MPQGLKPTLTKVLGTAEAVPSRYSLVGWLLVILEADGYVGGAIAPLDFRLRLLDGGHLGRYESHHIQ